MFRITSVHNHSCLLDIGNGISNFGTYYEMNENLIFLVDYDQIVYGTNISLQSFLSNIFLSAPINLLSIIIISILN